MKRIGFSGSREGMSDEQKEVVRSFLADNLNVEWVHHGDCIGADKYFHSIVRSLGFKIKGHLPIKNELRAFCDFDEVNEPKEYLIRNKDIIDETDFLIVTPKEMKEQKKGGTWHCYNYAHSIGKPILIIWPDGSVRMEKGKE